MNSSELTRGIGIVGGLYLKGGATTGGASISAFTGTITNGTSGTFAGQIRATPGSLLINLTTLKLYINTNTKASPTWTVVGAQS